MAKEERGAEDTKATRETKVKGETTAVTDTRAKMVSPVFPAAKDLPDQTAWRGILDQRETLVLME